MGKTVFLGVEGSGKTTLAMALLRAFGSHKAEGWYMRPLSRDSFRFVETMPSDFLKEGFPAQTSDLHELSWQLECNGENFGEIEILDYPGEIYRLAFLDEKDERDKDGFRQKVAANKREIDALLGAIKNAEDVFVLLSLEDAVDIKDKPRNLDAVWITYECLNTLKRLNPQPNVKLLFTQADKYREGGLDINDPMFSSLDLIMRSHADVPALNLSVIDPPESEYGIDSLLHSIVTKSYISQLSGKFGNEVVNDLFGDNQEEIGNKLLREANPALSKHDCEIARQYREKLREVVNFILKGRHSCLVRQIKPFTDSGLKEIFWIQEAVSLYLGGPTSKKLREKLLRYTAKTGWIENVRKSLIVEINDARARLRSAIVIAVVAYVIFAFIHSVLFCRAAKSNNDSDIISPLFSGLVMAIGPTMFVIFIFRDIILRRKTKSLKTR